MYWLRKTFNVWKVLAAAVVLAPAVFSAGIFPQEGLVVHLDAGTVEGVADGGLLTSGWQDVAGSGRVAASANPPSFLADAGGYPAIRFDGKKQYLELDLELGSQLSVFIVFAHQRANSLPNYRDILISSGGTGTNLSIASSRSAEASPDYPSFDALTGSAIAVETWLNGHATSQLGGDLFRNRFYVGTAVYEKVPTSPNLLIGTRGRGGFNAGQNDIREILIYDRMLSEAERYEVQHYLGKKYDIELVWGGQEASLEAYPHVLGSQQFGTHYSFGESGVSTVDYARAMIRQGNRVVKFRLSNRYANTDGFTPTAGIDSLLTLVRDQPEVKSILDMPLTDYIFWTSSFSIPSWQNNLDAEGLKLSAQSAIYAEIYDLAAYLLQTYNGTGKRFYLGNWEGDWMLSGSYRDDPRTIPANRIQGMIDWATIRQKAIDDAKAATPHENVEVWFYLELNKADWMREGLPCVANSVIPAMDKLDMVSISSYSMHKDGSNQAPRSRIHSDLDQVQALMDAKPDPSISGSRIIIGEYGWIYSPSRYASLSDFADAHRITARNFISWQGGTLRFVLQWQFFNSAASDNGVSKEMSQIGPDNDLRPMYYLHENFYRLMRRWVADYVQRKGKLPNARAYADQANYVLGFVSLSEYNPVLFHSTYTSWKQYHFRDAGEAGDDSISGPEADPYGSGIPNLLRYGLGMGKFSTELMRFPRLEWEGGALVYAFPFDAAKSDLRWRVLYGGSPGHLDLSLFDSRNAPPILDNGWLEISLNPFLDSETPTFYRLNLELIP